MNMENHPVLGILEDMAALVRSKAADYADDANVYSNFEGAAHLANVSVDTVFHVMIGIKMERLRQLMTGKEPNHEGVEDTIMDAANYLALWLGYRRHTETWISRQLKLKLDTTDTVWYDDDEITGAPI